MSKIQLTDSTADILVKMSEGNLGAIRVLTRVVREVGVIDPQDWLGGLGVILSLDTHCIYGSKIWTFYKNVCGQDLVKMVAVLRACQLGVLTEQKMLRAIDNRGPNLDLDSILKTVKGRLKEFARASEDLEATSCRSRLR